MKFRNETILVTGAGGFIGGHLVGKLLQDGYGVRAVDKKPQWQWYQRFLPAENLPLTLEEKDACLTVVKGCDRLYNLAADMGGMGFVELNRGLCMLNVLINTQMLMAARACGVTRFFYSSSACVCAGLKQQRSDIPGLKEADANPADPVDGYGWEKLFSERMAGTSAKTSVSKQGWPAKIMLMVPTAPSMAAARRPQQRSAESYRRKLSGHHEIEIWGDGEQTRNFMSIDDCLYGTRALMDSDITHPLNIGSSEMVTINGLWISPSKSPGSGSNATATSMLRREFAAAAATTR